MAKCIFREPAYKKMIIKVEIIALRDIYLLG